MSNDAAAEKSGPAEHSDDALVGHRHGSSSFACIEWPPRPWTEDLLTAVHDESYFVQMGIDVIRDLAEVGPFFAEFRRSMSRLQ